MSQPPPSQVLVVDDERAARFGVRRYLERRGLTVFEAESCAEAREHVGRAELGAMILDLKLPDGDGLQLLRRVRDQRPDLPVVLLTGTGTIERAVEAMKLGAYDFLIKPLDLKALADVLDSIFLTTRRGGKPAAEAARAEDAPASGAAGLDPFVGDSAAIRELAARAQRLAVADATILLLGETGTGKGVLARWLHEHSRRRGRPFLELNCAALSRELLQSELFGHLPGAFTGADRRKTGLLEAADGGTLFLDEIGDLDLELQPKLLKVLEEKTFRPLGEVKSRSVDVRLIAATHPTLIERVESGDFRQDLFFRISTLPLRLPTLGERLEDLPRLAETLLAGLAGGRGEAPPGLTAAALDKLGRHAWPGNIRELRNVLERASLLAGGDELDAEDIWFDPLGGVGSSPPGGRVGASPKTLMDAEIQLIRQALRAEDGHVGRAAARLDIARSTLYEKLKKYRIGSSASRTPGPEDGPQSQG
jgi:DNA-binding NtrC family response regulator